ncbi:MAG: hypothetical protein MSC31_03410 [Solirubrobacteraceae bacterium MAG38_C4-C5]|nr:hypothetical protein [Candidatus Siliceabacter maunaloa]
MPLRSPITVCLIALAGVAGAGCGDDEAEPEQSDSPSPPQATTAEGPDAGPPEDSDGSELQLTQQVRVIRDGEAQDPSEDATVEPGDTVQLLTTARGERPGGGTTIRIVVPAGSGTELRTRLAVEGSEEGEEGVTLRADEGQVRLTNLRYVCEIPPEGFCPVETSREGDSISLVVRSRTSDPIALTAVVAEAGDDGE